MFACSSFFARVFWIIHGSRIPRFRVSPNVYRCWIAVAHVFEFSRRCAADSAREWASGGTYSNGSTVTVTHKTVPIEVSVRTPWGAVKVPPITFAVMPGSDDVVLFGVATMKALGPVSYTHLTLPTICSV